MKHFRSGILLVVGLILNNQAFGDPLSDHDSNKPVEVLTLNSNAPPTLPGESPHYLDLFVKEVFKQINLDTNIRNKPALRTFKETELGFVDGSFPHIIEANLSYKNMIAVPTQLGIHELVAITIDPDLELSNGISSLKDHKVGYIAGWIMIEPLLKYFNNSFAIADKYTLFSMLKPDRFDVILYSKKAADDLIKQDITGTMRILEPVIRTNPLYLFMHKKHQKILPLISKKIKQLKNGKEFKF